MLDKLEIGPSPTRMPGFTTVDIDPCKNPDYLVDASDKLPFEDEQFEFIYASHIIGIFHGMKLKRLWLNG